VDVLRHVNVWMNDALIELKKGTHDLPDDIAKALIDIGRARKIRAAVKSEPRRKKAGKSGGE